MPTYWGKEEIKLVLDLFCRVPPVIDPNDIPRGDDLKRFISDYSVFNKFEDHKKCFYVGVKRYATQFRDDVVANEKGDKRKGTYFYHVFLILLLLK